MVYNIVHESLCIYACYHLESIPRRWAVGLEGMMCAGVLCSARFSIAFVSVTLGVKPRVPGTLSKHSHRAIPSLSDVSYFLFLIECN